MQIGRYVSGEVFSAEALKQIENHVAKCPSCARVLNDRRQALKSMLSHGVAAVTTDAPKAKENPLLKAIREKTYVQSREARLQEPAVPTPSASKAPAAAEPKKLDKFGKPAMYSAALAAVLIAMSFFGKAQNSFFGGSADKAFPTTTEATPTPKTVAPKKVQPANPAAPVAGPTTEATVPTDQSKIQNPKPKTQYPVSSSTPPPKTPAKTPPAGAISSDPQAEPVENAAHAGGQKKALTPPEPTPYEPPIAPAKRHHPKPKAAAHRIRKERPTRKPQHKKIGKAVNASVKVYDESGNPLGR